MLFSFLQSLAGFCLDMPRIVSVIAELPVLEVYIEAYLHP